MKKFVSLLLIIAFSAALLAGCGNNNNAESTPTPGPESTPAGTPESAEPTPLATGKVKTGLAVTNSIAKSADAGEKDGLAQADSIIVGVMVDANGKIIDCAIDSAQTKVTFGADGKILTPLDTQFKTKNELGANYGMADASEIGKEWYEQAAALAAYVIGKTADEVLGIAVNDEQHPADADLKASVTIAIGGYVSTIVKAVENARELGASESDRISLGVVTNIARSKDAAGTEAGLVQIYSTYTALTKDADGRITSCVIDASQSNVNFDASGKIITDLTAAPQTKNELKDDYGMKAASSVGKEWYEQAAAFAQYVTGKTASEVSGIAVDETGHAADSDLTASVTIGIGDFLAAIEKAAK